MNSSLTSRFARSLILASWLFIGPAGAAETASPPEASLTIKRGVVDGMSLKGQPMPATLRNLAEELMRRYPLVTINIAGVDEVVIDELTLRATKADRDQGGDAINAILNALAEVTDNAKFAVTRFSVDQFLLTRPRTNDGRSSRSIEIFNLKLYLEGTADKAALEYEVREADLRVKAARERFERMAAEASRGERSQTELAEVKGSVAKEQNRFDLLIQNLQRASRSKEDTAKRISELVEVVNTTLEKFSPGEKRPEYEYHPGTHLLIVIGSNTAINVTRKVVSAMEKSSN